MDCFITGRPSLCIGHSSVSGSVSLFDFTNNSIILLLKTQELNMAVKLTQTVDYYIIEVSKNG